METSGRFPADKKDLDPTSSHLTLNFFNECCHSMTNFVRRIFLNEMNSLHSNFRLIFPIATKFPRIARQNGTGFGVDEKFGDIGS
jgi:hypothetical protein